MIGPFAYSFNGDDFLGSFPNRDAALAAGVAACRGNDAATTIFVGRVVTVDPKASGHARAVLSHMAARAREEAGDAANSYLADLTAAQVNDLDKELEKTVLAWLGKNKLTPSFYRIEAVGEYPVNVVTENHMFPSLDEVHDLGVGDTIPIE
jgi:hypothetical protein